MKDKDVANIQPVSGTMDLLEGAATHDIHEFARPAQKQSEGQGNTQRILLVEDDRTLAALEAGILTIYGYTVVTLDSGEKALAALPDEIPDLVVLDLELTGNINGWDVLQSLRASTTIPVLLTTSTTQEVRTYIRMHGESKLTLDHLPKPYPMQTFLKRIQRMLKMAPQ